MTEARDAGAELLGRLDGGPGPARRLSSARTAALVAAIADAAQAAAHARAAASPATSDPAPVPSPAPHADRDRPTGRGRIGLLAAAIVLVSAGIAAATGAWLATRAPVAAPAGPPPPAAIDTGVVTDDVAALDLDDLDVLDDVLDDDLDDVLDDDLDDDLDEAAVAALPPPRHRPRRAAEPAPAPIARLDDLLAAANQRRKERRWREAAALYEQVMREHAGTDAAVVATVASASLHLDRLGDAAAALRRFGQALRARPAGPLAEEARWGLAEARRALGDAAAERAALSAFVAAHPDSPRLPAARRRLGELDRTDGAGAPR